MSIYSKIELKKEFSPLFFVAFISGQLFADCLKTVLCSGNLVKLGSHVFGRSKRSREISPPRKRKEKSNCIGLRCKYRKGTIFSNARKAERSAFTSFVSCSSGSFRRSTVILPPGWREARNDRTVSGA